MKKIFVSALLMGFSMGAFAQQATQAGKLTAVPEYINAQRELSQLSIQWQKEIETRYIEIGVLTKSYNTDAPSLTKERKQERLAEIEQKRQDAMNLQKQRFGINGDLYKKSEALLKPLQDKLVKEAEKSH